MPHSKAWLQLTDGGRKALVGLSESNLHPSFAADLLGNVDQILCRLAGHETIDARLTSLLGARWAADRARGAAAVAIVNELLRRFEGDLREEKDEPKPAYVKFDVAPPRAWPSPAVDLNRAIAVQRALAAFEDTDIRFDTLRDRLGLRPFRYSQSNPSRPLPGNRTTHMMVSALWAAAIGRDVVVLFKDQKEAFHRRDIFNDWLRRLDLSMKGSLRVCPENTDLRCLAHNTTVYTDHACERAPVFAK